MKKITTVCELARQIVGDGKSPNKYFITIAYGCYKPKGEDTEMIQVKNSLDSSTILFLNKIDAEDFYHSVCLSNFDGKVTGQTIGQVLLEDRKVGVLMEKYLEEGVDGTFRVTKY